MNVQSMLAAVPGRSRVASIVGLTIALGAPFVLPLLPGANHQNIGNAGQDAVIVAFEWAVALALLAIVLFWERLPLGSIGFRRLTRRDLPAIAIVFVAMYAALVAAATVLHGNAGPGATAAQIAAVPLALRVAMFLTAGFCEELMLRAYTIERLGSLTGKLWIGGVVSVVVFTLGHVPRYGFSHELVNVAIIAIALAFLYVRTRNFWACATVHAVIDFFGLIVVPALSRGFF